MIDSMKNAFCLKDKVAIITGGDTGIGFGIAAAFAQQRGGRTSPFSAAGRIGRRRRCGS